MFTGLVAGMATVQRIAEQGTAAAGKRLTIAAPAEIAAEMAKGDSLAVNGLCLTLVHMADNALTFDVIAESLKRSNLTELKAGNTVNLELPMRLGERLDGHLVAGHIDCTGLVCRGATAAEPSLQLSVDADWHRFLFAKGSIALNGVSLTLGEVHPPAANQAKFSVHLIAETLAATNLSLLKAGDRVNVETDQLARYIVETTERAAMGRKSD